MSELTSSLHPGQSFAESEELLLRLKAGDEAAFTEAFELYRDMVYTIAFRLLADRTEASDLVQETFMVLFRRIHKFRGECALKTWLYRVAVNQAANRNRWWQRRFRGRTMALGLKPEDNGHAVPDLISGLPSADRQLFSRELQSALQQALKELPFEQRVAVVLRDVEALTYEEIAEVTGNELGTVKSRIARGRERLRELLRDFQERTI